MRDRFTAESAESADNKPLILSLSKDAFSAENILRVKCPRVS